MQGAKTDDASLRRHYPDQVQRVFLTRHHPHIPGTVTGPLTQKFKCLCCWDGRAASPAGWDMVDVIKLRVCSPGSQFLRSRPPLSRRP